MAQCLHQPPQAATEVINGTPSLTSTLGETRGNDVSRGLAGLDALHHFQKQPPRRIVIQPELPLVHGLDRRKKYVSGRGHVHHASCPGK